MSRVRYDLFSIRSTAGIAQNAKTREAECIPRPVTDVASRLERGIARARPVDGNQAHAERLEHGLISPQSPFAAGAGDPMRIENRFSILRASVGKAEAASIGKDMMTHFELLDKNVKSIR